MMIQSIVVFGVGDGGGQVLNTVINAVEAAGLPPLRTVAVDTHSLSLTNSLAARELLLGNGLGAGGDPARGRELAAEARHEIEGLMVDAQTVVIIATLGGGTGGGAAPVIAEVANTLGKAVIGVVSKPLAFEGSRRLQIADQSVAVLRPLCDPLLVADNVGIAPLLGTQTPAMRGLFKLTNHVMAWRLLAHLF